MTRALPPDMVDRVAAMLRARKGLAVWSPRRRGRRQVIRGYDPKALPIFHMPHRGKRRTLTQPRDHSGPYTPDHRDHHGKPIVPGSRAAR